MKWSNSNEALCTLLIHLVKVLENNRIVHTRMPSFQAVGSLWPEWMLSPSLQHASHLVISAVEVSALVFVTLFILRPIKRRYFSALYSIPGPFWASITRAWRVKEVYNGGMEKTELELHRQYGSLCRILSLTGLVCLFTNFNRPSYPHCPWWSYHQWSSCVRYSIRLW